jgi:ADP-heptose:LPS heptosyltransferase
LPTSGALINASLKEQIESLLKKCSLVALRYFVRVPETIQTIDPRVKNILVVRQHDQLGDMLCAIPLLHALRSSFPSAHITLITGVVNHDIMLHHPYVDRVLLFPKGNLLSIIKFGHLLRKSEYDLAIVPATVSFSFTSALISLIAGARVRIGPRSIGTTDNPAGFCFTNAVDLDWTSEPHRHQTLRNLDLLLPVGILSEDLSTTIGFTSSEKTTASSYISEYRRKYRWLVGIHPGAGKIENRWPAEKFASLVNRLSREHSTGIVISIGPMDNDVFENIRPHLQCEYLLLRNKPIREVAAVIDQLDLFISNDTGLMHVAGATTVHLLALFGPTDPLQWAPVGKKNHYLASRESNIRQISEDEVYQMAILILSASLKQS